jgi:hypothetical protein
MTYRELKSIIEKMNKDQLGTTVYFQNSSIAEFFNEINVHLRADEDMTDDEGNVIVRKGMPFLW